MTQEEGANDHFWSECVESFGNRVGRGRIKVTPRHRHSHFPNILSFSMSFSRNSLVSREFPAWGDAWDNLPSRLRGYNQSFGLGLSEGDFFGPSAYYPSAALLRPRRQLSMTEVRSDADRFLVLLDVSHFTPEEITVKTVDDQVLIQGCHEEKVDEHGLVSRQFTRRYTLPPGVDPESVRSSLGAEGVLSVEAPRKRAPLPVGANERPVPITIQQPQTTSVPVQREEKTGEDKSK